MSSKNPHAKQPASLRKRPAAAAMALGLSTAVLVPMAAIAQEQKPAAESTLQTVNVIDTALEANPNAEPGVPYKAKYSGDERHKRALAETAQNIQVLTKAQIEDSGYTDLREILDAQPGITLGTGENGNAFGDRYIIRGQEARSDVFVDGLRDPGMTIRESFATEQVEISKGPNSSFAGRGTSGGAVNSVTKQATTAYDYTRLSTGFGTDKHTRLTLDTNQVINEDLAVRANLLYGYEEVPDRAPTDRDRKGIALSTFWTPTDKLDLTFDYYGLDAEDNPDMGGFLVGDVPDRKPAKNVPVYAQSQDFLESDVDILTARLRYQFSPDTRITNLTRVGQTDNGYVVTGARAGTFGKNDPNAGASTITLSTHQGWQEVEYFVNQTNLHLDREIGGLKHEFIFGLEYSDHSVLNGVYNVANSGQNCITGNTATGNNGWCATDANGATVNGLNSLMNRQITKGDWDIDWNVKTISLSAMDTVDLTEKLTAFAGLRWDRYDFDTTTVSRGTTANYDYSDSLWNGHVGLTYKFLPYANVYASYSTASDINGGESDVGSSCGYGGICVDNNNGVSVADSKPEKTQSIELGTKWNLMDEKLLLSAALFQITKSDVMESAPSGSGYESTGALNTGKNRVRGLELALTGMITPKLTGQAGVAFMKSKVLESNVAANEGKVLSNFADNTAFLQLKYQATDAFSFGGALKYEGKKYAGQPDTAAGFNAQGEYSQPVPAYSVLDLFANYRINKNMDVRLNVGNVTDKDYYLAAYRSGSFLYMGDARNARVTLNYDF
ncbi:TonB-dependent receptor [Thauera aminoaromatica]|uniref:TonB-dependent siderophore receptor n=1 Tax=Thauera aminoaromatica TaxID=164330 RepID=A0A5C7T935_THASP|nr:TonB-dependent receptor [Thauera aminoaromatica]TXH92197.1 MAG: TonB-dependent siderophore receptor [Thauera aminoaromatica]